MIAAQHKNDKLTTTTRDTKQEKLLRWEEIRFQDLFETVSIFGESRMRRGIVFHTEGPATAKALSPFCVLVGGTMRRALTDAQRVTGPCSGLDLVSSAGGKHFLSPSDQKRYMVELIVTRRGIHVIWNFHSILLLYLFWLILTAQIKTNVIMLKLRAVFSNDV